jgi:cardiolipin synthase
MQAYLEYWPWLLSGILFIIHVGTSIHVLLARRDAASSIGWIGVIWLAPLLGPVLYFLLGINRIQRKARRLRGRKRPTKPLPRATDTLPDLSPIPSLPPEICHLMPLVTLVETITERPLTSGNRIEPLYNGEEAYPAMLEAIGTAKATVALSTYIFYNDTAGARFVEALAQAVSRGVEVRVLIDDIGGYYTWSSVFGALSHAGVPVAAFLPKLLPRFVPYANMCNHRKLLIVDGCVGFTGGMNITAEHLVRLPQRHPTRDVHFRIVGPLVSQLQEIFVQDWEFAADELLQGERWFPDIPPQGAMPARGIASGPDADLEKLRLVYAGALACARSRVLIVNPYFLPEATLISALIVAALRGVQVDILVPHINDMRLVKWASFWPLQELLEYGCRVWQTPPPFTHTKLMLIDGGWTLFGSGNWDPRSLRLNFEFDVECYDRELTEKLEGAVMELMNQSRELTLAELNARSIFIKIRDGLAKLLTPYL